MATVVLKGLLTIMPDMSEEYASRLGGCAESRFYRKHRLFHMTLNCFVALLPVLLLTPKYIIWRHFLVPWPHGSMLEHLLANWIDLALGIGLIWGPSIALVAYTLLRYGRAVVVIGQQSVTARVGLIGSRLVALDRIAAVRETRARIALMGHDDLELATIDLQAMDEPTRARLRKCLEVYRPKHAP